MAREVIPTSGLWSSIAALLNGNFTELYRQSGWSDYVDDTYTSGSPLAIDASTDTVIPNDAGTVRDQELPADYSSGFYNAGKFLGLAGDGLLVTIEARVERQSGSGAYNVDVWFDIGSGVTNLYRRTIGLRGSGANYLTFTTAVYTLDTWETNGGEIYINSDVAINMYDIRFVVHRLHKGFGTYPPA